MTAVSSIPGHLTTDEVAERVGISTSTWSAYVSRGHAPPADLRVGRTPLWRVETIRSWQAARPGRGARTDLP